MPLRILFFSVAFAVVVLAAGCSSDEVDTSADSSTSEAVTDGALADESAVDSTSDNASTDDNTSTDDNASTTGNPSTDETTTPPDPIPLGEQVAEVIVVGDPLDVMPPGIPVTEPDNDPAIGRRAPELSGTDFAGEPVEIVADGTPRVIMFVAHWCGHCQREIPAVKELIDAGALPAGLDIVVVSTAVREGVDNYPPQTWLQAEGWPGPIMRDSELMEALVAFGVGGFPFSVYLNADHEVVTRSAGEIPAEILQQIWLATVNG